MFSLLKFCSRDLCQWATVRYPAYAIFAGVTAGLLGIGGETVQTKQPSSKKNVCLSSLFTLSLFNLHSAFLSLSSLFSLSLALFPLPARCPWPSGGMVLGPLLVALGCDAMSTAATSSFAVLITATAGLVQARNLVAAPREALGPVVDPPCTHSHNTMRNRVSLPISLLSANEERQSKQGCLAANYRLRNSRDVLARWPSSGWCRGTTPSASPASAPGPRCAGRTSSTIWCVGPSLKLLPNDYFFSNVLGKEHHAR